LRASIIFFAFFAISDLTVLMSKLFRP